MTKVVDPRITWAVSHLQRQLADPMPLADLAAHAKLSPSRFRGLFIRQVGVSPSRYLRRLRLLRARLIIERTSIGVREVMTLVGYQEPSHFSRDFQRFHGVSPTALRSAGMWASARSPGSPVNQSVH